MDLLSSVDVVCSWIGEGERRLLDRGGGGEEGCFISTIVPIKRTKLMSSSVMVSLLQSRTKNNGTSQRYILRGALRVISICVRLLLIVLLALSSLVLVMIILFELDVGEMPTKERRGRGRIGGDRCVGVSVGGWCWWCM